MKLKRFISIGAVLALLSLPLTPAYSDHLPMCKTCGAELNKFLGVLIEKGTDGIKDMVGAGWTVKVFATGAKSFKLVSSRMYSADDQAIDAGDALHKMVMVGDVIMVVRVTHENGSSVTHSFLMRINDHDCTIIDHNIENEA